MFRGWGYRNYIGDILGHLASRDNGRAKGKESGR